MRLPRQWKAALVVLILGAACTPSAHEAPNQRQRGGAGLFWNAREIAAPEVDRCAAHHMGTTRELSCQDALFLARTWARGLSPGDTVCLEGGVGEDPGAACMARASVVDVATGRLLIELREARPDSKHADAVQQQRWYAEGALVDLYLDEQGW